MSQSPTGPEHLIHMANDIAHFFAAGSDREAAIVGISNHMKSFWTPNMRRKLISEMSTRRSDEPLEDLPRAALRLLREYPEFEYLEHKMFAKDGSRASGHNMSPPMSVSAP